MRSQKNVLLIIVDCLRADFANGERDSYIPTIDKLRKNGFYFQNCISPTTTTVPNFTSLFTGLYPFEHGVRTLSGYRLSHEIKTLPEILKYNGYNTYAEMTGPLMEEVQLFRGFNEYSFRESRRTIHTEWGDEFLVKLNRHYKHPWFTVLHIWSLHLPRIIIKQRFSKEFGRSIYSRALSSIDFYLNKIMNSIDNDTILILIGDHGERIASTALEYYVKRLIKFIFKKTRKTGLAKKYFKKGIRDLFVGHGYSIYDELVKTPFILNNNECIQTGMTGYQVRQIDIMPTILDILGVDIPDGISGRSTLPLINREDTGHRDAYIEAIGIIIPSRKEWLSGLRVDNKYKYIYAPFQDERKEELYFLDRDPAERCNVAEKYPELTYKFRKQIEDMKVENLDGEKIETESREKIEENLRALGYLD